MGQRNNEAIDHQLKDRIEKALTPPLANEFAAASGWFMLRKRHAEQFGIADEDQRVHIISLIDECDQRIKLILNL